MTDPGTLWSSLSTARPNAGRLALLTCLPVRVQPELVRLARLRLVGGDTGDEADLWLSDLVETRSAAGFSYRRAVREYLRARLGGDPALLDDVWFRVHMERSAWLTPRARLEEELAWRLLRDRTDPEIDLRWEEVIRELDASANPEGVARWIVRAVPDLPEGTLDHAAGRRAFYGASLLLGDATVLGGDPQRFLESGDLAFATRRLPRRRIVVALSGNGLIVSPSGEVVNGHEIDIPATRPLWLQIEDLLTSPPLPAQVVTFDADEPRPVAWPQTAMGLRTIDGALYGLEPERAGPTLRARRERVDIEYDVEIYGAEKKIQLPFVVGVFSDLSGQRLEPLAPLEERKMLQIDADNFDDVLRRIQPRLSLSVARPSDPDDGLMRVELQFSEMADFLPWRVAMQVPYLRTLLLDRRFLIDLQTHVYIDPERQQMLNDALSDAGNRSLWAGFTGDEFASTPVATKLLAPIDPKDSRVIDAFVRGVPALCRVYEAPGGGPVNVIDALDSVFPDIDRTLSRQIEPILKHPAFQELEGTWRGFHEFVNRTETDEMLKIRVLNVSKAELAAAVARGTDGNAVLDRVYYDEYSQLGGEPYGLLVGDFYFDHSEEDVTLLEGIARVAATAHAPFVAGAAPRLLGRSGWGGPFPIPEVDPRLESSDHSAWNRFRESELANYVGLALPRYLARRPYSSKHDANARFTFDERAGESSEDYVWANAAYVMARHVTRAFHQSRWFVRIAGVEGGGSSELPSHDFPMESSSQERVTEAAWTDRLESVLTRQGLMVLMSSKDGSRATFFGARSLFKVDDKRIGPGESWREALAWNTGIGGDWRRLLPCCRFIHYIKCIVRDTIGSFREPAQLERFLQAWITNYVDGDATQSSTGSKAFKPLVVAQLHVDASPDEPDWTVRLRIMPHHQIEGIDVGFYQQKPQNAPEFTTRIPNVLRGPAA